MKPIKHTRITYQRKFDRFKYDDVIILDQFVKASLAQLIRAQLPKRPVGKKEYHVVILANCGKKYHYLVNVA